jgi:hypothetical protein
MGELWRDLVELLRRRPALWLPVLLADLLGYLLNLLRGVSLRALVLHETAQRSALGGAVVHTPLSPSAMQSASIFALLLSWFTYFLRMLLYSGAFVATAALVQAYLQRQKDAAGRVGPAFARHWGGILELALRALSVYALAALLFGWVSPWLAKHGQTALLHSPWFGFTLTLLVLVILSLLLPPVALRVLAGAPPRPAEARVSQQFALVLVLVAALLASFVSSNSRQLAQAPPAARFPLEIIGSLVVALPYVLLFVGLAILARQRQGVPDETEA